jgi:hypothetical protein
MALDQDHVVDAAEIPAFPFVTRLLSGLVCQVMLHHAEASLQHLIILVSFI